MKARLFTYSVLFGPRCDYLDCVVYAYYLDRVVYSGDREAVAKRPRTKKVYINAVATIHNPNLQNSGRHYTQSKTAVAIVDSSNRARRTHHPISYSVVSGTSLAPEIALYIITDYGLIIAIF